MKILMVDDEQSFLEQAVLFLERDDRDFDISTSLGPKEALEKLDNDDFDAIVSDYQMPEINGLDFLQILREERGDDIPFIIFTGKGREEVAMKALNVGADRYLQKGGDPMSQFNVLAQAIDQEVTHHRTKKKNEELTTDLQETFDTIAHPIFLLDDHHRILRTNEAAGEFFDEDEQNILGQYCYRLAHKQDEPIDGCPLKRSIESSEIEELEFYEERLDKYFKARTNPIVDSNNEVRKFVHHLMDITDRKKKQLELEKKERWFNAVFNDPNSFIGVLDTEGNLLKANKKSLEFVGATQDQVKEKKFWNTPWWQHSDEGQRKLQEAVEKASKGEFVRFEVEHHVKDNEKVEVDFSLRPVYKEDEVVKLIAEGRL